MNDDQMLPKPDTPMATHGQQAYSASNQPSSTERSASNATATPRSTTAPVPLQGSTGQGSSHVNAMMPIKADDIDLIEKEWVTKAKAIVSATLGDPHRQSLELSNAKNQYIAKRFNKELPGND